MEDDEDSHHVPIDLVELYEAIEWEKAVKEQEDADASSDED